MNILDTINQFTADVARLTGGRVPVIGLTHPTYSILLKELRITNRLLNHTFAGPELTIHTSVGIVKIQNTRLDGTPHSPSLGVPAGSNTQQAGTTYALQQAQAFNRQWPELSGAAISAGLFGAVPAAPCDHQWVDIGVMHSKFVCKVCDIDKDYK